MVNRFIPPHLKSNDNRQDARFIYPLPPEEKEATREMEIYARFMRHMRCVPNSRREIKILSSIQFTADLLNESDAFVAKLLVGMGLRAPRNAFPDAYLEHIDKSLMRSGMEVGSPTKATQDLRTHWNYIGEDQFAAVRRKYAHTEAPKFIESFIDG